MDRRLILAIGLMLMLAFLAWIGTAILLFLLFFGMRQFHLETFFEETFFSVTTIWFLLTGTAIGAVYATIVFSISAISLPMVIDRKVSATIAVLTGAKALLSNWRPFVLWAGLIVAFTVAGVVSLYVGLVITLPLIGHASWHAYRDLVA